MGKTKNKISVEFIVLLVWSIILLAYFIVSNECPGKWYCSHHSSGEIDLSVLIFWIFYIIVLLYEIVKVLLNPIKRVINKLAYKIKIWDFKYGWVDKSKFEVIQYTPPVWINSAEAGLLIHRYASTTDMISLLYKRESEKLIDIKTQQDEWKEYIIIEKSKNIWKKCPKYEESFFFNLFHDGDTLKLWEWTELSKMCNLSELEEYWINMMRFFKPWFHISFNMFLYIMLLMLIIITICLWGWTWLFISIPIVVLLFGIWYCAVCLGMLTKNMGAYISTVPAALIITVCCLYFFSHFSEIALNEVFVVRFIFFIVWIIYLWRKPHKLKLSKDGILLKKHLLWFRKFILTCDEAKITSLLKSDPLFYDKVIPYAIVFWVETDLLKKLIPVFDDKIDPRDWIYKSRKALWKF